MSRRVGGRWQRTRTAVKVLWEQTGWRTIALSLLALAVVLGGMLAQQRVDVARSLHIPTDPTGPNWADIAIVVLTAILVLAGISALATVTEARKARNAQQMTELLRHWDEEKNREIRRHVMTYAEQGLPLYDHAAQPGPNRLKEVVIQLRQENSPMYRTLTTDPGFLEDLAIMVEYGGIDYKIVNLSLGYQVAYRWSLWKPATLALRKARKVPDLYINFENLAARMAWDNPQSVDLDEQGEILWDGFRE